MLIKLKTQLDSFEKKLHLLEGELNYLKKDYENNLSSISKLEIDSITHIKAIELLQLVQVATREKIKDEFENLVSWALTYVFGEPYKFILEFGKRGNLSELNFKYIPPHLEEPIELTSGGILNVTSLILRIIMLELMKVKGFLLIDEALSFVNGNNNIDRLNGFIEQIQDKFKRQIIHITDMDIFKENPKYNLIEIK